jgi:alkanesulfonate monooxygenase SsuD/methylene tetrahydromethanopterin reductase-like flavin-dependent oxidoreductase (luciferase family)
MLRCSAVGSPDTVKAELKALLDETEADELIITAPIYSHTARLRSYELAAQACRALGGTPGETSPIGAQQEGVYPSC